jgi:hypothetical protein
LLEHVLPAEQVTPHAPQFGLVLRLVHEPPQQTEPAVHAVPQLPQCPASDDKSKQAAPQACCGAVQLTPGAPAFTHPQTAAAARRFCPCMSFGMNSVMPVPAVRSPNQVSAE